MKRVFESNFDEEINIYDNDNNYDPYKINIGKLIKKLLELYQKIIILVYKTLGFIDYQQ